MISFDVLFERMDRVLEAVPEEEFDRWVVFDFDGVCSSYKQGWQGKDVFGLPVKGTAELVSKIQEMGVKVALVTTRPATPALEQWLEENEYNFDSVNDTSHNPPDSGKVKPIAELYVDDRGYRFDEDDVEKSGMEILDLLEKASHVTKPAKKAEESKVVEGTERITREYKVEGEKTTIEALEQIMHVFSHLGNIGASREFKVYIDGDGAASLTIIEPKGLKPVSDEDMERLLDPGKDDEKFSIGAG